MIKLFQYRIIILILFIILFSCRKDNHAPYELNLDNAKNELPLYYSFLNYLKNEGYEFWDFHTFWISDKDMLPDKLMVLRHDVHHRDVFFSYCTYLIEKELLGNCAATYYVMLDNPSGEINNDAEAVKDDYLDLIQYLKERNVDVQPHISPCDLYSENCNPDWENLPVEELKQLVSENYQIHLFKDGIDITIDGTDILDLDQLNDVLMELLRAYNTRWKEQTGLQVESYAAHGSASPLNHALGNTRLLNQRILLREGIYKFETSNTIITNYLTFIHDNERPEWIESPGLIEDGIYQLLVHPFVWNDPQAWRDEYGDSDK